MGVGPFSTIHRDLITEVKIHSKVKVRRGPMMGGYSTSGQTNDAFIKRGHFMAKARSKLNALTKSYHQDQENMTKLLQYCHPFINVHARHLKTRVGIDQMYYDPQR